MSALAPSIAEFAQQFGVEYKPGSVDLDATGADYLAACKRHDCVARYDASCPAEYRESDWTHPKLTPYRQHIERVRAWRPEPGRKGLLITGLTGRGKTRSVWALVKAMAEEGRDVRVWHAADFFSGLQAQIKYGSDDARGWIEAIAKRPVIVLDDLGQEAVQVSRSEWAQAWFFRFLDLRLGAGLPLIITTNLTADTIAGRTEGIRSDPLIRRLLDLCEVIKFEPTA